MHLGTLCKRLLTFPCTQGESVWNIGKETQLFCKVHLHKTNKTKQSQLKFKKTHKLTSCFYNILVIIVFWVFWTIYFIVLLGNSSIINQLTEGCTGYMQRVMVKCGGREPQRLQDTSIIYRNLQNSTQRSINEDITFSIMSNSSIGFKVRPDKRRFHHPKKCSRYVTFSMYIPGKPVRMLSLVWGNEHQGPLVLNQ